MKAKISKPRSNGKAAKTSALAKSNGSTSATRSVVPLKHRRLTFGNAWDFAPAPEAFEHIKVAPRHELFINGKFIPPSTGTHFDSINPATEEKLTEIALGG